MYKRQVELNLVVVEGDGEAVLAGVYLKSRSQRNSAVVVIVNLHVGIGCEVYRAFDGVSLVLSYNADVDNSVFVVNYVVIGEVKMCIRDRSRLWGNFQQTGTPMAISTEQRCAEHCLT